MTLEQLKDCQGFSVSVSLDGGEALAQIESRFSKDGFPQLSCPPPKGDEPPAKVVMLPITEEVAAKMVLIGGNNLLSTIRLASEGDGTVRYAE